MLDAHGASMPTQTLPNNYTFKMFDNLYTQNADGTNTPKQKVPNTKEKAETNPTPNVNDVNKNEEFACINACHILWIVYSISQNNER